MGSSKAPDPPPSPDYAAANREAVVAQLETLPAQRQIEAASKLGLAGTATPTGSQAINYDFTGLGEYDLQKAQAQQQIDLANLTAPQLLELNAKYGVDFVNENRRQQEAADPEAFKARQLLGAQINEDLALGDQLSSAQRRNIEQQTRKAQVARGNLLGDNPAIDEAIATQGFGEQLKQQRQSNAQAFNTLQPLAQYNAAAAQSGATPFQPLGAGAQYGTQVNPNAGQSGVNFAQGNYSTAAGIYGNQLASYNQQGNPWMTGLGALGSLAGQGAGIAAGFCWVAREVYGIRNPEWLVFREWLLSKAPTWFRNLYLKHGMQFAGWVRKNPWSKLILRPLMDMVVRKEIKCQTISVL